MIQLLDQTHGVLHSNDNTLVWVEAQQGTAIAGAQLWPFLCSVAKHEKQQESELE